jgi:TRAP-type C4-dicarboxylate transport system substrate-binding protein
MKKYLTSLMMLLLIGLVISGGCAESTLVTARDEPIELSVSTWGPPDLPISKVNKEWADMIEEQSGHRVKFTFYWDQSLVKAGDTWKAIQTGIADIGYFVIGFGEDPTLHVLNGFTGLPFIGWQNMQMATDIYHKIFLEFPELEMEFKGTKLLWSCSMPPNQIHTVNKEIRVPADYKGEKVLTAGSLAEIAANAGAAPITNIGPNDWQTSLETGLADSLMVHWSAVSGYGLIPIFKYHTNFGDAGINMGMHGMWANKTVWDKLPKNIQDIILNNSSWIEERYISIDEAEIVKAVDEAKSLGHTFSNLNEDEIERWKITAASVTEKWIEKVEDMGLPARAVYDEVNRLIKEYKK